MVVKLTDTDPVTDTLQPQAATLNGSAWQVDYRLLAADPTGTYTLTVQAQDQVGNVSEFITLITLGIDARPAGGQPRPHPGSHPTTITSTLTLAGASPRRAYSAGVGSLRLAWSRRQWKT